MRLLLDTQVLIWLIQGNKRLTPLLRATILDAKTVYVSEVSLWEISVKISVGKLQPIHKLFETVGASGYLRLSIRDEHLLAFETLPFLHRDPFDRMLVAQAMAEQCSLMTSDSLLHKYGIPLVMVA